MTQTKPPAISFHDLTLGYDRHPAVHHITGEVHRGDLLALVGPNGAGKSTLLKGIVGQLKPLSGSLSLDGLKRSDIAYLPQQIDIDRSFPITVFDAVAMGLWHQIGTWRGLDRGRNLAVLEALATLGLQDLGNRGVGALSGGQQQMLAIGRALMAKPRLLLLDEPSMGLAPNLVDNVLAAIRTLKDEKLTILLVEQNARAALSIADRAYVMETGKVTLSGPAKEIQADSRVREAYLGI
jgi:zinc/manganese transport system ATP-binding protein